MNKAILSLKTRLASRKLMKAMCVIEAFMACRNDELIEVVKDYIYDAKSIIEEINKL